MIRIDLDIPQINFKPNMKKAAADISQQYDDLDIDTVNNLIDQFDPQNNDDENRREFLDIISNPEILKNKFLELFNYFYNKPKI